MDKPKINVTKSFLPPIEEYVGYLEKIWSSNWLTNHGPFVTELEEKLKSYLGSKHLYYVCNGTIALQIAIKALELNGEIITTPFSYVATTSSIVWENCKAVFADIEEDSLTINPELVEEAITADTSAILATHVYGNPCNVEKLEEIAKRHKLKIIYDAAHCFGVRYNGNSILKYGDISTLSFHATKLFHTVEGGAVVTGDDELAHKISYLRNFGHNGEEDFWGLGVNGKSSEFHAAMGLCLLPRIGELISMRKETSDIYDSFLMGGKTDLRKPALRKGTEYNYSYYPVIFESEASLLNARKSLNDLSIFPRRYFYPNLTKLNYVKGFKMPVAESISARVLCLPLHAELEKETTELISHTLLKSLKK